MLAKDRGIGQPPSDRKGRTGRKIGPTIFIGGIAVLTLGLAISRLTKGCANDGVALLVLGTLFLVFAVLSLLPASPAGKARGLPRLNVATTSSSANAMVEVMRSTDVIVIEVLRGKLVANGIPAEIVGEQSSRMLGHLPGIPLRLMVPRDEFPRCAPIINEEEEEDGA